MIVEVVVVVVVVVVVFVVVVVVVVVVAVEIAVVAEFIVVEIVEVVVVVVVAVVAVGITVVAEFIVVEIVEVGFPDTRLFSLVVVSLVELQACTTGIVITVETMRSIILQIVFPLLDIIIQPEKDFIRNKSPNEFVVKVAIE